MAREPKTGAVLRTLDCDAILFDLDGVLVDSARVVVRTWHTWARQRGLDAKAAGMRVVAVATTHPEEELHEADVVVGALSDVRVLPRAGANGPTRLRLTSR